MLVTVTQGDIDAATALKELGLSGPCPLEFALTRTLDKQAWASYTLWGHTDSPDRYPLPKEARKYAMDFDTGEAVRPRAFEFSKESVIDAKTST